MALPWPRALRRRRVNSSVPPFLVACHLRRIRGAIVTAWLAPTHLHLAVAVVGEGRVLLGVDCRFSSQLLLSI